MRRVPILVVLLVARIPAVLEQLAVVVAVEGGVLRVRAVVGHARVGAGLVRAVGEGHPRVGGAQVLRYAEGQAELLRRALPEQADVLLRADVDRVPGVVLAGKVVEVVVVHGLAHEVARPGLDVEPHQPLGVEVLCLPERDQVLVAELGGMAVGAPVVAVLLAALLVHVAGVPVAVHGHGLRPPVRPDAELGVPIPLRAAERAQAVQVRSKGPLCDVKLEFAHLGFLLFSFR